MFRSLALTFEQFTLVDAREGRDVRRFRAPGRANLIGEHTDHTDGLVLPAAIDRALTLDAELGGESIRLTSAQADEVVDVPADGSVAPEGGFGRFVTAVAYELAQVGRAPVGMTGRLSSHLPQGAGLSSSAALEVVVATALCAATDLTLEPLELAALCRRAEHRAVGVPSGIMDQAASILGRAGHAVLLDCGTLEHRHVPLPTDHALLILDSGVQRRLESSGYAQRSEELGAGLHVLEGRRPADVDPAELPELLASLPAVPARRLRHVVSENVRVREAAEAFAADDLARVGELFAAGHASLRDDYEVSIPELDALVELSVEAGATAARMTGGGFGGAIVVLVPDDRAQALGESVLETYRNRFPATSPSMHVCHASDGAGEQ
jgi:galactokinase